HTLRYAVHLGDEDPYRLVDDAFLALRVVEARGGGERPSTGSVLRVEGAEVSAFHRQAGAWELRVFNPTDEATVVETDGRGGGLGGSASGGRPRRGGHGDRSPRPDG